MKRTLLLLVFAFICNFLHSQISGKYHAFFNGDNISLELKQKDQAVTGTMKDSQQNYTIAGEKNATGFEGTAIDDKLGITFLITGTVSSIGLEMDFDIEYEGARTDAFVVNFEKDGKGASVDKGSSKKSKKYIDPSIIGNWKHESFYSSGYGADAMSGSSVQYLSFNADGTMSDKGGEAMISGSDYSGNSGKGDGSGTVANLWYYTSGNSIIIYTMINGAEQEYPLGTYYIEDGKLLITAANGEKKLLQRVR
ncbi:MAG TPA: hypothetical protein PKA71_07890 [Saprospiraceae bacterium]|nr:hypothetical protein [Saprospiraceae bacterium]